MNIQYPPLLATALTSALLLVAPACATATPSAQLVDARQAYNDARNGYANEHVPDHVYEASVALQKAERAHERKPGSEREQHLSYVAHRKALEAKALADERVARTDIEEADETKESVLMAQRDRAHGKLESTEDALANSRDSLDEERRARIAAERTAADALASLQQIASVKAEDKRTVITLSGAVLFKTDESELLPIAENKLDKVAEVLRDQSEDKTIVIEGHTDSRGSADYNEDLSHRRADSVRDYLVAQGVPSSKIQAVGKGEEEPIAKNATAEGRANNRRVEIIIDEEMKTASR